MRGQQQSSSLPSARVEPVERQYPSSHQQFSTTPYQLAIQWYELDEEVYLETA